MSLLSRTALLALVLGLGCASKSAPQGGCTDLHRESHAAQAQCGPLRVTVAELKAPPNAANIAEQLALWDHQFPGGARRQTHNTHGGREFAGLERESHDGRWRGEMRVGPGIRGTRVVTCGGRTDAGAYRCGELLERLAVKGAEALTLAELSGPAR